MRMLLAWAVTLQPLHCSSLAAPQKLLRQQVQGIESALQDCAAEQCQRLALSPVGLWSLDAAAALGAAHGCRSGLTSCWRWAQGPFPV